MIARALVCLPGKVKAPAAGPPSGFHLAQQAPAGPPLSRNHLPFTSSFRRTLCRRPPAKPDTARDEARRGDVVPLDPLGPLWRLLSLPSLPPSHTKRCLLSPPLQRAEVISCSVGADTTVLSSAPLHTHTHTDKYNICCSCFLPMLSSRSC